MSKNIDIYFMFNKKEYTIIVEKRDESDTRKEYQEIISFERDRLGKSDIKEIFVLNKSIESLDYLFSREKISHGDCINFYGMSLDIKREDILFEDLNMFSPNEQTILSTIRENKEKYNNLGLVLNFAGVSDKKNFDYFYNQKEKYKMMKVSNIKQAKYSSKVYFANRESFEQKKIENSSFNINKFLNKDLQEGKDISENNIEETVINNNLNNIKNIDIYTDGSLVWNSGGLNINAKGYGIIVVDREKDEILFKIKGRIKDRKDMIDKSDLVELYAIQRACNFLNKYFNAEQLSSMDVSIYTDSNDITEHYRKAFDKTNSYSYSQLWNSIKSTNNVLNKFAIKWIKGHDNHIYNEMADKLAKSGAYFTNHEEYLVYKSVIDERDALMKDSEHIIPSPKKRKLNI